MKILLCIIFSASISLTTLSCSKKSGEIITLSCLKYGETTSAEYKTDIEIIEAFQSKYPSIKIDLEYLSGESYHQKIKSMAMTENMPDLFTFHLGEYSSFLTERNLVMDLRPYLTDKIKEQFNQNIFSTQGPNGEIYILSEVFSITHIMYANKKIMTELNLTFPKTEKELISQGEIIRSKGLTPIAIGNKEGSITPILLSPIVGRFGGKEWFERAIIGEEALFSDTNFINALNTIKTLSDNKMFNPNILELSYLQGYQEFVQGNALYLLDTSQKLNPIMQDMGKEANNIELHVYPAVEGETVNGSTSAIYSESLAINANISKEKVEQAFRFIMFFVGEEGSSIRMKNGVISTYKLDINNYDVAPLTKKFVNFINNIPSTTYVIDNIMNAQGIEILNNSIKAMMLNTKTPKQVAYEYEDFVSKNEMYRLKELSEK